MKDAVLYDPARTFEVLNCAAMMVSLFIVIFIGIYLVRETNARQLGWVQTWLRLSPSMGLALAFWVFSTGVLSRSVVVWVWRRFFGSENWGAAQQTGLIIATAIITVGGLCVIRSATKPTQGNWPWLLTVVCTVGFTWLSTFAFRSP